MEYKGIIVYALIAVIIVAAVLFVLSSSTLRGSYNVNVALYTTGQTAIYPYQTSHFVINVTNNGTTNINNMLLGFYLNGIAITTNTVSIPPHQSIILYRTYTYKSSGNYNFQAVADSGHLLDIKDRPQATGSFESEITQPQTADVYSSIPNGNITSTQEFTLSGLGAYSSVAVAKRYNITLFNQLFGPSQGVMLEVFQNLAAGVAYAKGAYVQYANNSTAYVVWLQGTVNTSNVNALLSSFVGSSTAQYNGITYTRISNTLSICDWYESGWTKLISYYNNSNKETCMGFAPMRFNSSEGAFFNNSLISKTNLTGYQSEFYYTNSTALGGILSYSNNSMSETRLFNNTVGLFATGVSELPNSINGIATGPNICYGLIYSNGSTHVCSVVVPTKNKSITLPFELVKSTEILPNYLVSVYSLVNSTLTTIAHDNAANLINVLTKNSISATWTTGFQNGCLIENLSMSCKFLSFNYNSTTAYMNITNMFASAIKINKISCEYAPGFPNTTINQTIQANKTASLEFACHNLPIPSTAPITQYDLNITYVVNGSTRSAQGLLNVTNQALSSYT